MLTPAEWLLILVALVILLVWGPDKIPKLARAIGHAIAELRRVRQDVENEVRQVRKEVESAVKEAKA